MKLPVLLYLLLLLSNLLSLCLLIGYLYWNALEGSTGRLSADEYQRCMFYLLYVTVLLNLYGLSYIAIRKIFER